MPDAPMRLRIGVHVLRGGICESRHRIEAVVSDPDARLDTATEHADTFTTFRSAAKPFQLLPVVERGHADRWGWNDEQLAVMAASHTGSAAHVGLVTGILDRLGLGDRHLACGYHDPIDPRSLEHVRAHPDARTSVYNNCSGKHAGMLCLAVSEGWPVEGYHRAGHPVQQLVSRTVAEMCGVAPDSMGTAVDGCNVPVFGMPLAAMARAYARLAAARPKGDARAAALARIRRAMSTHPVAVAGEGRFGTVLMQRTGGRMVVKGGAEGLECVGLPERGLGLALKCEDGHSRALAPATLAVLEHLGELSATERSELESFRRPVVTNCAGVEVGALEAVIRVLAATP